MATSLPMLRTRAERPWFDSSGAQQNCANCGREKTTHWHTLVKGESVLCQTSGDWYRRVGTMRPTDQPVRGRQREETGVEDCPCQNCGSRPGRYPFAGRGPAREVLCPTCTTANREQGALVPRVCVNGECGATSSTLWAKGLCSACYSYAWKGRGKRTRSVVEE